MFGVLKLLFVPFFVKGKVMISSDDNFVFVGQFSKEVLEPFEFRFSRILCEVPSMNENISFGQLIHFKRLVFVMGIGSCIYSNCSDFRFLLFFHSLKFFYKIRERYFLI